MYLLYVFAVIYLFIECLLAHIYGVYANSLSVKLTHARSPSAARWLLHYPKWAGAESGTCAPAHIWPPLVVVFTSSQFHGARPDHRRQEALSLFLSLIYRLWELNL